MFLSPYPGKLIVVEGIDGSGKTIHTELLVGFLKKNLSRVHTCDFPRYGHPAAFFVERYLGRKSRSSHNSKGYGPTVSVSPQTASRFYALDRFDAAHSQDEKPNLWDYLKEGFVVVSNRYTQSNIGHQANKLDTREERESFIRWLLDVEYNQLRIPRPDMVILLDVEPEIGQKLKLEQRKMQGTEPDDHERNLTMLALSRQAYLEAAAMFPESWRVIKVSENGVMRAIKDIHAEVRELASNFISDLRGSSLLGA